MDYISRKMEEVADLPRRKLDLQFFAGDGTPDLEDSPEFADDAKEFNAKMDSFTKERAPKVEVVAEEKPTTEPDEESKQAGTPEVAVPGDKPKQDPDTNKAFQTMRKELEEAKARADAIEAKAKKADELIAQQYGQSHGLFTVEQYEQQVQREQEEEEKARYAEAGLTPEEVQILKNFPQINAEREQEKAQNNWKHLYDSYPEVEEAIKKFNAGEEQDIFNAEMQAEIARGASPLAAYRIVHFDSIMQNQLKNVQEVAKQEALDKINSKEHLAPNASTGGEVDHIEIDDETMRAYRALNKGKSDAQIRAWHKKHAN